MGDTAASDRTAVTGRLLTQQNGMIVLGVPASDYQLHLMVDHEVEPDATGRVTGTIHGEAKRVDVIEAGGRFIEPVIGRPRRVQGRVIGGDLDTNTLAVHAGGAAVVATLMPPQKTADFAIGQLVAFDVARGAAFKPTS